jgi:hypothetical protein
LRKKLISKKLLAPLLPPLRHFFDFLYPNFSCAQKENSKALTSNRYSVREFVKQWKILESTLFTSFGLGELVMAQPTEEASDLENIFTPMNTPGIRDSAEIEDMQIMPQVERALFSIQDDELYAFPL